MRCLLLALALLAACSQFATPPPVRYVPMVVVASGTAHRDDLVPWTMALAVPPKVDGTDLAYSLLVQMRGKGGWGVIAIEVHLVVDVDGVAYECVAPALPAGQAQPLPARSEDAAAGALLARQDWKVYRMTRYCQKTISERQYDPIGTEVYIPMRHETTKCQVDPEPVTIKAPAFMVRSEFIPVDWDRFDFDNGGRLVDAPSVCRRVPPTATRPINRIVGKFYLPREALPE